MVTKKPPLKRLYRFFDPSSIKYVFFPWLEKIGQHQGETFCRILLEYTLDGFGADDSTLFIQKAEQHLSEKLRGDAMTIAEQLRQEGMQQGMQQGIETEKLLIAKRLLSEGAEIGFISRVTEISLPDLRNLKKTILLQEQCH